jgi:Carboxypeptidase regulatory-like domain
MNYRTSCFRDIAKLTLVVMACLTYCVGGLGAQVVPSAMPTPITAAIIGGVVKAAGSGEPIVGAEVRLVSTSFRITKITDSSGRYLINNVPSGVYTIFASKDGFVSGGFGQSHYPGLGRSISVTAGDDRRNCDISLSHGGVVSGWISDENGQGMVDVQVRVARFSYVNGQRRLTPVGRGSSTNDLGEFRLFAIPLGRYYIVASPVAMSSEADSGARVRYVQTYYPSTPDLQQAVPIDVTVGGDASGIAMALAKGAVSRLSGRIVDSSGSPLTGGSLRLLPHDGNVASTRVGVRLAPDGAFSADVSPGDYVLVWRGNGVAGTELGASLTVKTTGEDIAELRLTAASPVTIRGRVIPPTGVKIERPSTIRVISVHDDPSLQIFGGSSGIVQDDLSFELKVSPGVQHFRLAQTGSSPWTVKQTRMGSIDVTDDGVDIAPGARLENVEVELSDRVGSLVGTVQTSLQDSNDAIVVVFAEDQRHWGYQSGFVRIANVNSDGSFAVQGLREGHYHVIALSYLEPGQENDLGFLDSCRNPAKSVTITSGVAQQVNLRIMPMP